MTNARKKAGRLGGGSLVGAGALEIPTDILRSTELTAEQKIMTAALRQFPKISNRDLAVLATCNELDVDLLLNKVPSTEFKKCTPRRSVKKTVVADRGQKTWVQYWNGLPKTRKHNGNTATARRAEKYIKQILKGAFWVAAMEVKHRGDDGMLTRPWSEQEMKTALYHLSLLFVDGYWPAEKDQLPRDLPGLIYNERTQYSFLVSFAKQAPKPLRESVVPVECLRIAAETGGAVTPPTSFSAWIRGLHFRVLESGGPIAAYLFPTFDKFFESFLEYVRSHSEKGFAHYKDFQPGSKLLQRYERKVIHDVAGE